MKVRDVTVKFTLVDDEDYNVRDVLMEALFDFAWELPRLDPAPLSVKVVTDVSRQPNKNEKKELNELYNCQFEHEEDEG